MKIEITLDELLEISKVPLREYLKNWQNDSGNPLEFDGDLDTCKITAIGCINCEILLGNDEKLQLDKERIKGLSFDLVKIDDIVEGK